MLESLVSIRSGYETIDTAIDHRLVYSSGLLDVVLIDMDSEINISDQPVTKSIGSS